MGLEAEQLQSTDWKNTGLGQTLTTQNVATPRWVTPRDSLLDLFRDIHWRTSEGYFDFRPTHMKVSWNRGISKSPILMGFSIVNLPCCGYPHCWKPPYLDGLRVCFYASYDLNEHIVCIGLQASQVKEHTPHTEAFSCKESFGVVWEVE